MRKIMTIDKEEVLTIETDSSPHKLRQNKLSLPDKSYRLMRNLQLVKDLMPS